MTKRLFDYYTHQNPVVHMLIDEFIKDFGDSAIMNLTREQYAEWAVKQRYVHIEIIKVQVRFINGFRHMNGAERIKYTPDEVWSMLAIKSYPEIIRASKVLINQISNPNDKFLIHLMSKGFTPASAVHIRINQLCENGLFFYMNGRKYFYEDSPAVSFARSAIAQKSYISAISGIKRRYMLEESDYIYRFNEYTEIVSRSAAISLRMKYILPRGLPSWNIIAVSRLKTFKDIDPSLDIEKIASLEEGRKYLDIYDMDTYALYKLINEYSFYVRGT